MAGELRGVIDAHDRALARVARDAHGAGPFVLGTVEHLGTVPLHWWASAALALGPLPDPLPIVTYDAPCGLRDLALDHLDVQGAAVIITAQSPHLSGIQAALRSGLVVALLAAGADGLRRIEDDRLAQPLAARLWLVTTPEYRHLADPLKRALRIATGAARIPEGQIRAVA
ncbi:MAG: hypothetical protein ACR2QA_04645 [Solirubrobacteraceae bacterium]